MKISTSRASLIRFAFLFFICIYGLTLSAQCGFRAYQRNGCLGTFTFNLQDTTAGVGINNTNWIFIFSNGDTVRQLNYYQASLMAPVCGRVIVIMNNTLGCHIVDSNFFVYCLPKLRGAFNATVSCSNSCIKWLDSSIAGGPGGLHYLIDWGGGALDTLSGTCHYYHNNGSYSPSIIISNSAGCQADTTFSNAITITAPPTASFTGNLPRSSCVSPFNCTMTAVASGSHTKYIWSVAASGSGAYTQAQANGSNVFAHSYGAGTWDVKLVVRDTLSGCTDSTIQTAYVTAGSNDTACFTANVTTGCAPAQITFCPCTPQGPNGTNTYQWILPGATPSLINANNNQCVSALFSHVGKYTPMLVVQFSGGCIDTLRRINYISLGNRPSLSATLCNPADTLSCTLPDTVCVSYTGSACAACAFSWTPYNGGAVTNTTPNSHTGTSFIYNAFGNYAYSLNVTDTFGCSQTLIQTNVVNINQYQVSAYVVPLRHSGTCNDDTILVINTTPGASLYYADSFPGATRLMAHGDTTYLSYHATGCHPYSITMTNTSGCTTTYRDSICTAGKPQVSISYAPKVYCYLSDTTIFQVQPLNTDTPTVVHVWPLGLIASAPSFNIPRSLFADYPYIYTRSGNFSVAFQANNRGCLGDTVRLTAAADSIHIYPPSNSYRKVTMCNNRDSLLYISNSQGADSIVWTVGCTGTTFTNADSIFVGFPNCGVHCPVSLTTYNRTYGCRVTRVDSLNSVPCYGVDFNVPAGGCFNNYREYARIQYLGSNVIHASQIFWDFPLAGNPPVFNHATGLHGNSVFLGINDTAIYGAFAQITYANGCIDTIAKPNHIIVSGPIAGFTTSGTAGCLPYCVQFTDTSTFHFASEARFVWNFGDGTVDTVNHNPQHCYITVGQFNAYLTVYDSNGCVRSSMVQIQTNSIHAGFAISDTMTCTTNPSPLNPVSFRDTSMGFVGSRIWNFTPSASVTNANPGNVSYFSTQFGATGTYTVQMIAIDQFGLCHDTAYGGITVANPVANYSFANLQDTSVACPPVVILHLDDSSRNQIAHYLWNFGDGNGWDSTFSPGHIWTLPGYYPITHAVISAHGCSDTISRYAIHIHGPIIYRLRHTASQGCPPLTVTYYLESYNADSIEILSGGGSHPLYYDLPLHPRGTAANHRFDTISFTYTAVGIYHPSVTVYDTSSTCTFPYYLQDSIIVDTPSAHFTYQDIGCGGDSVCFTNTSTTPGAGFSYTWFFGDGTIDTTFSPCHHYPISGIYPVSLVISSAVCGDTAWKGVNTQSPLDTPRVSLQAFYTILPPNVTSDILTATPTHGGTSPTYIWFKNSTQIATTSTNVYTMSGISNNDTVWVKIISNQTCVISDTPVSNRIVIIVTAGDSIWPGDLDDNGLADQYDLLPIGVLYGKSGPNRPTVDIAWTPHFAPNWSADTFYAFNDKYADCNGDGLINANDTMAIWQNFGLTHPKTNGRTTAQRSGIPTLNLYFDKDTAYNGDTLTLSVVLGDSANVVNNIYGVAFVLHFDPTYIDPAYLPFDFTNSWIGNGVNSISLSRLIAPSAQVDAAIVGINHTSRSGYGRIAQFRSVVNTNISPTNTTQYLYNPAHISGIVAIDKNADTISLNAGIDTNVIVILPLGINEIKGHREIHLYPNPANDKVQVQSSSAMKEIVLTDILGQTVQTLHSDHKLTETIDISRLNAGIYFVQVYTANGSSTAKLLVRR